MVFRSEQYNFFDQPTRLFLMKATRYGLPVEGLHLFRGDSATMQIKLASLLQVVDAKGPKMNQGETVTLFNDLCLMAPAALIDKERIQWEPPVLWLRGPGSRTGASRSARSCLSTRPEN